MCLYWIGGLYKTIGQYDKAIEHYWKALALFEELGRKREVGVCLNNIGEVYRAWGQYDKAIEYYRQALALSKELGTKDLIAAL